MATLNLFKHNPDKPRLTIRERFRNAAARVMPRSRGSRPSGVDTSRRALMSGVAATAATLPLAASAGASQGDAALIEAWGRLPGAMARNVALNMQIKPLSDAAIASLSDEMMREEFLALSEEEQEAHRRYRDGLFSQAWKEHGVTALLNEQDRLWDEVIQPLVDTIRNTAPTTMQGAAIKAAYLIEYGYVQILDAEDASGLDYGEEGLRLFIEQLADFAPDVTSPSGPQVGGRV